MHHHIPATAVFWCQLLINCTLLLACHLQVRKMVYMAIKQRVPLPNLSTDDAVLLVGGSQAGWCGMLQCRP